MALGQEAHGGTTRWSEELGNKHFSPDRVMGDGANNVSMGFFVVLTLCCVVVSNPSAFFAAVACVSGSGLACGEHLRTVTLWSTCNYLFFVRTQWLVLCSIDRELDH